MHDISLITTIAAAFTGAWILGLLTQRLGLSPIVGYLLAGVLLGPHTPGFVADVHIAQQLAEIGVILLMFGVGLHFHWKDLLAVKGVAIPGAIAQSVVATALAMAIFAAFDIPLRSGAVIGMAIAVASTVVLMRVLMDANVLESPQGHVAVGWLIVEDIFTVVLLVLIPVMGTAPPGAVEAATGAPEVVAAAVDASTSAPGSTGAFIATLAIALAKLGALVAIVVFAGARVVPWALERVARLRSRELFTLTVLVFSVAIAAASYVFFGASMALGAFLAGIMVGQSPTSHQAAADALPMRDAFAVIFFVSVGMLFEPTFLIESPMMIVATLAIILIAKPITALVIVAILGHTVRTGLTVAIGLAQIGEFSFILSELARQYGLMPDAGHSAIVAAAIISITLNPLLFRGLPRMEAWLRERPRLWAILNGRADRRGRAINADAAAAVAGEAANRLAVVVGYGPVGRSVHRLLRDAGIATVVVDLNMDTITQLVASGQAAIFGDAAHESILEQAGARRASHIVLTLPNASDRAAVVVAARNLNASARILVRARYLREREDLERAGATAAVFEEAEAAVALARLVLADTHAGREVAERRMRDLRVQLILENVSSIRTQPVRSAMVPWSRVRRLPRNAGRDEVMRQFAEHRYSRWPVVEPPDGRVIGYLHAKDLVADRAGGADWTRLVRPLRTVAADADVESTLVSMQRDGAALCVVEEKGDPVGLITLEDIIEQLVGRIEDEDPHEPGASLRDAIAAGAVVLDLRGRTAANAIEELVAAIPATRLPPGVRIAELALAREAQLSTDLGNGVAVPHARCPGLAAPVVAFGRSGEGVVFAPQASAARSSESSLSSESSESSQSSGAELVRLVFLLVTPAEEPDLQLTLLGEIARFVSDSAARERLSRATSHAEVVEVLGASGAPGASIPSRAH